MKKGWEIKTLADICTFENGDRGVNYPSKAKRTSRGIPFINAGHFVDNKIDFTNMDYISRERYNLMGSGKIQKGDILFCLRGSLGKFASVENLPEGQIASSLVIVRPSELVSHEYLLAYFESYLCEENIERYRGGAAQPNLSAKSLTQFTIPIPPLPEQQRIVSVLAEAFASIAQAKSNAERNLVNARELFASEMNAIFENGKEWKKRRLGDFCERVSVGHVGPTSKYYCDPSVGIPFLRSQNVRSGYLDWEGVQYITKEFHQKLKKSQLHFGDILFVRVGANRGDCCVIKEHVQELNCANIVFARPKEGDVDFIERYCQSKNGRDQLLGMSVGSAQGVINTKSVAELIIPYPSIAEQRAIVGRLEVLSAETGRLEEIYQQKVESLEELKRSVLAKAFSGEL